MVVQTVPCLTCTNQSRLVHAEQHGHQRKGGEVHAQWCPLLPKGTVSSIHYGALAGRPGRVASYPLTESRQGPDWTVCEATGK